MKVARLQSEVGTEIFNLRYELAYEKCTEISPEIFESLFCRSRKILPNSRQISPHKLPLLKL